ncbi:AAA family ATPase [Trichocoleus sp. FACHB-591]|uniref:polysaccharide biosynthesis tyrosine autokinase n=1 Tax=Trichocoleus sp. FACHB-591 TaxID=2692872 RepID=UPI001683E6E8|nr:polysaccharide biosynthesis tyrosine autokinase [Trichocoleus sp. FACHB-591]MBD2095668.1 AAA family ATPase [Trichocoleus sp. FACHB-591]
MKVKQSIQRYFAACRRYGWVGLAGFALTVALAGGIATFRPDVKTLYVAQKLLLNQSAPATPPDAREAETPQEKAPDPTSESPQLTDALIEQMATGLQVKRYSLSPQMLRQNLTLRQGSEQGDRWLVQFQDAESDRATAVVVAFSEAIAQQDLSEKRQGVESKVQLLEQRRDRLRDDLRVVEEKLREFSRREKPAIQQAVDGSLVSAITTIQQQQRELDRTLEGTEAEMASLQNQLQMSPEQAYLAAAISADAIVTALSTKVDELALQQQEQLRELQPRHPEVVALQQQQSLYEARLQQRIQEIVGRGHAVPINQVTVQSLRTLNLDQARQELANRLVGLKSQRDRLTRELAILGRSEPELRQNYSDGTALRLELEKLTNDVARNREALEQTEKDLAAAELQQAETKSDWVSEGAPQVKTITNWLWSRPFILLLGGSLGLLVAGATILLIDLVRGKILMPEEVETILQKRVPLLGILPSIRTRKSSIPILIDADSPELESYELFHRCILNQNQNQAPKVVMLSSIRQGEGKTVSTYNLAIAAARAGKKTLLIEADLRTPSRADIFRIDLHLDEAEATPNDVELLKQIQPVPHINNLFILPSFSAAKEIAEALESNNQQLFKQIGEDFDFVVLDTTTLHCSDVLMMESLVDGFILITRLGYSDRKGLELSVEKITESKSVKLLGIVINDVTNSARYAPLLSL